MATMSTTPPQSQQQQQEAVQPMQVEQVPPAVLLQPQAVVQPPTQPPVQQGNSFFSKKLIKDVSIPIVPTFSLNSVSFVLHLRQLTYHSHGPPLQKDSELKANSSLTRMI